MTKEHMKIRSSIINHKNANENHKDILLCTHSIDENWKSDNNMLSEECRAVRTFVHYWLEYKFE